MVDALKVIGEIVIAIFALIGFLATVFYADIAIREKVRMRRFNKAEQQDPIK